MSPRHSARQLRRRGHQPDGASTFPADPTQGTLDAGHPGADATEQIKAPGFAALLRRHPQLMRQAAFASIAVGAAVFVVASTTTQLAGAQTDHPQARAQSSEPVTAATPDLSVLAPVTDGRPTPAVLRAQPALTKAPASRAVISGLAANGIPNVALNAYRVAAARMNHSDPGCGIDWSLLAGIGRVESDHGRFGGAVLHADGTSTPRIIGIALNGTGTEVVRDTDHGRLDGDPVYDRAVGPMQFIPSTWASYGVDANGDGVADPFNINDAALTAARYLCAAGGNLRSHAGQVAAVLTYNHSDQYLAQVLALADAYHRGIKVIGVPNGNTTGKVTPASGRNVPPANPGGPTAVDNTAPAKATPKSNSAPRAGTSAPRTSPSSSTPPRSASSTPTAAPTAPPTGSGGSTPAPSTSSGLPAGSSSSPTPSPGRKCVIWDLLNPGRCAVWG